jgi:hypothetical protein
MLDDRIERLKKLELRLAKIKIREKQQQEFLPFVKAMWPEFISGRHHEIIAKKFEALAEGKIRRLIITMPPRHTKSEFASFLLPAWMMGRKPNMKIIQATHTAELAVGFGRKVKNLLLTDQYHEVFPETELAVDSQASGRWNTTKGGDYHALGVGGAMAGKGADLCHPFGTLVVVDGKQTPVENVQVGDQIETHYGRQRVTAKWLTTHAQSIVLNGALESSPDHRYLVDCEGGELIWQQAAALEVGSRVMTTTIWRRAWNWMKRRLPAEGYRWRYKP